VLVMISSRRIGTPCFFSGNVNDELPEGHDGLNLEIVHGQKQLSTWIAPGTFVRRLTPDAI
jgi:hypothetical protein